MMIRSIYPLIVPAVGISVALGQNPGPVADRAAIVDTVQAMFAALATDDGEKLHAVVSTDFYLYEQGKSLTGDQVLSLIKTQHQAGRRFEWHVTEPDVHIVGSMAWIAYRNKGSISDSSGSKKQEWQESAVLRKEGDSWKIVFMHSNRVPESAPTQ